MSCGCSNYPFSPVRCDSQFPPCGQYTIPYLTQRFLIPDINTDVTIEVTSTASMYVGKGIQISLLYYQVTEILTSTSMVVRHNGLSSDGSTFEEGEAVNAVDPNYGCFQYPLYNAGLVNILYTPTLSATGNDGNTEIVGALTSVTNVVFKYGYLGPSTVKFSLSFFVGAMGSTPYWVSFTVPGVETPEESLYHPIDAVATYYDGTNVNRLIASVTDNGRINVGIGNGSQFSNGSNRIFSVAGTYETFR